MFEGWLKQENCYIFRITAVQNLEHILKHGIACRNCEPQDSSFVTIGGPDIISKRDVKVVPIVPNGTLSDYVPFYFAPRSPMLGSIAHSNSFPQEDIIHIVSKASKINEANIPYVFSNGHALMEFSVFKNDLNHLDIIDWDIMHAKYWRVTEEDNDRQRRRMAEFLVHRHFPAELITGIGVKSEQIAERVQEILNRLAKTITIKVFSDWYY